MNKKSRSGAMANPVAAGIGKDRIGEPELSDRCFDLIDLALRIGTGVAWIGNEVAHRAIGDGQPRCDCD